MLYQSEKRQKAIKKIFENAISRKSIFFRLNLSINGKRTNTKIIKVKKDIDQIISGLNASSSDVCLLIERTSKINIDYLKTNLDIVGTNYHGNVLGKSFLKSNEQNIIDWTEIGVKNIWIFKEGWIKRLEIKINSNVSTKETI